VIEGGAELHVKGTERVVPQVVAAVEAGGFVLADLTVAEPTLENVFISLTGKELRE
jgi:ABC-2 type transport system ATP-binding protein